MGRSRGAVAPPVRRSASNWVRRSATAAFTPTWQPVSKRTPSARHLGEPAVEHALFHLELRDAVAEQPADAVVALEHGHPVTGAVQLLGRGEAGGARADDRDLLARPHFRRLGPDPALLESVVDDAELDALDGDGIVVDAEHAGALAGRRAERPRELREIVRCVEPVDGLAPPVPVHEIVPVGNEVAQRAPLVAEGDAAVHAPGPLLPELVHGPGQHDLMPVAQTFRNGPVRLLVPLELDEPGHLTHMGILRDDDHTGPSAKRGRMFRFQRGLARAPILGGCSIGGRSPPSKALSMGARHDGLVLGDPRFLRLLDRGEDALEVLRNHLDEPFAAAMPVHEEACGHRTLGVADVT